MTLGKVAFGLQQAKQGRGDINNVAIADQGGDQKMRTAPLRSFPLRRTPMIFLPTCSGVSCSYELVNRHHDVEDFANSYGMPRT